jgi:hypothetical protein
MAGSSLFVAIAGSSGGASRRVQEAMVVVRGFLLAEMEEFLSLAGRATVAVGRRAVEAGEEAEVCKVEEERAQGMSRGAMGRSWKRKGCMGGGKHRRMRSR